MGETGRGRKGEAENGRNGEGERGRSGEWEINILVFINIGGIFFGEQCSGLFLQVPEKG